MKNRHKIIVLISIIFGVVCVYCTWKFTGEPKPYKGEIVISDALKEETTIEVYRLPKETSEPKKKHNSGGDKYEEIYSDEKVESYPTGVVVIGDTAYEQYTYIEDVAVKYIKTINNAAKKLKGISNVYSLVVPTSIGITLPDNKSDNVNSSSQKDALNEMYNIMSDNVKKVSLYDTMMKHRKEYIYFRTDHHWTQLGAYYAYNAFCQIKGIEPNKISDYEKVSFGDFLGSFYSDTDKLKSLKKDELEVYYPINSKKIILEYTNSEGQTHAGNIIEDGSKYGKGLKYNVFIDSDNPYTIIKNKTLADGSTCVVVKESFGNAFVPYLADHYQRIYVIDYRYWSGSLSEFAKNKSVDDVIIINNISMTRNLYQVGKLALLVEG